MGHMSVLYAICPSPLADPDQTEGMPLLSVFLTKSCAIYRQTNTKKSYEHYPGLQRVL